MAKPSDIEKWGDPNCPVDEEEEALSLSDLPVNENENVIEAQPPKEAQDDFNFNFTSCGTSLLPESEMCAADEVFFQGRLLPFRHSVSSETGLSMFRPDTRPFMSRSQSMDLRYTSGAFSSGSSTRSSSIRSDHNSLTSGSSSASSLLINNRKPPKTRSSNQFHSYPSPTPQLRISTSRHGNYYSSGHNCSQKSTLWSYFQVGLVRTPDINMLDLKIRSNNTNSLGTTNKSFGSRNSNSSSSTSASTSRKMNRDTVVSNNVEKKKKGWTLFDRNRTLFSGCSCSSDAIDLTVGVHIGSGRPRQGNSETIGKEEIGVATNKKKKQRGKQAMSRYRTFEWLKQLSLEGGPEDRISRDES